MEEIIHHKFVNERLSKEVTKFVTGVDPIDWFSDESTRAILSTKINKIRVMENVTTDEFKKAMSNNEKVSIFRETIIVSENSNKNTISLKKYIFSKETVPVKTTNRLQFKIIRKEMYSLTINKTNGDFCVYHRNRRNAKKTSTNVRKNILNHEIKYKLSSLLQDGHSLSETKRAVGVFYQLLGYDPNLQSYNDIIKLFFNTDPRDKDGKHSLMVFPFLNYLYRNKINIQNYYLLYPFEVAFKKNKSKYIGSNILDYFVKEFNIKNVKLVNRVLTKLNEFNRNITYKEFHSEIEESNYFTKLTGNDMYTININMLRILDYYNVDPDSIDYFEKLFVPIINYNDTTQLPPYFFKLMDLYEFKLIDVIQHNSVFISHFYQLHNFYQFGVKLKISSLSEFDQNEIINNKIYDALCMSRNETGTFSVSDKFIKRLRRYVPKNVKISLSYGSKIVKKHQSDIFLTLLPTKIAYDYQYELTNILRSRLELIDSDNNMIDIIHFSPNQHQSAGRTNYGEYTSYQNLINALSYNKNNILDTIEVKQLYSRNYFEELCIKKMNLDPKIWVDYIE